MTAGAATDTYNYDAFGNKINSTGSTPNNYLYRGEQYDSDLGFYYLHARYYNPLTGRFLSMDPLASQNQKRYEYADADPVNELDPTGDEAIIEFALLQFYPGRLDIHFPTWCEAVQGTPFARYFPSCNRRHAPGGPAAPRASGAPPHTPHHKKSCDLMVKATAKDQSLGKACDAQPFAGDSPPNHVLQIHVARCDNCAAKISKI
jgi:RHS repeat-associated protein